MINFFRFVTVIDIDYNFLPNVVMPMMTDHRRHVHELFLCHGCRYLKHLFNGLLNDSFLTDYLGCINDFFFFVRTWSSTSGSKRSMPARTCFMNSAIPTPILVV